MTKNQKTLDSRFPPIVAVAAILVAIYEWALFFSSMFAPGMIGPDYQGVGTDWMVFHGAAKLFETGLPAWLYDGQAFTAYLNTAFAPYMFGPLVFRPWVNPPWFLLVMAPFGLLGFIASYAVGQILQAAAWAAVIGRTPSPRTVKISKRSAILMGLLSPAAALNALCGQTAFLVSTLVVCALLLSGKRAWLAGAALALLSFKPQFCPLIVVYFLASRRWRELGWAIAMGVGLIAASIAALGIQPWFDWVGLMLQGMAGTGQWTLFGRLWGNSIFACLFLSGIPVGISSAIQLIASLSCVVATWFVARRDQNATRKVAAVLLLTLVAAPYFSGYDGVLAMTALILAYRGDPGLMPRTLFGWTIPLLVWLIPFYSPPAINPAGRLTPVILVAALIQLYVLPSLRKTSSHNRTELNEPAASRA